MQNGPRIRVEQVKNPISTSFQGNLRCGNLPQNDQGYPVNDISLKYLFTHSWRSIGFSEEIFTTWVEVRKTFLQRCCIMNWACKFLRKMNFCKTLSFGHKIAITLENRGGSSKLLA